MTFAGRLDEVCGQLSGGGGLLSPHITWLAKLDDGMYGGLVGILPIEPRTATTLDAFISQHISSRTKLSQRGRRKLEQTRTKLVTFFGQKAGLREINRERADAWWKWMRSTVSEATARTHAGNAKGIFNDAVARRLIPESPVAHLPSGSTPREDSLFVERETLRKVIAALPTDKLELKLRLALCRFGGLRVDSEPKLLLWESVDFAGGRMWFHDQKRQRPRICPIDPELLPCLQELYLKRRADEIYVCHKGALSRWDKELIEKAIAAASVTRWPALFQSLRASYDTEVRMTPGAGDVAADAIVGHRTEVARKHYNRNLPESVFLTLGAKWDPEAAQNAAHSLQESGGTDESQQEADPRFRAENGHQVDSATIKGNEAE